MTPTTENDAEFIFELLNTPKWLEHIGDRNVRTVESAKAYINERMMPQLKRLGYGSYTIISKEDQQKIGTCGLYDREGLDGIDIGFAFLPAYEKKGFAFEAVSRLKDAAFNELNLKSISAITTKENVSSQRLLEKLGLQFKKTITIPNDDEELLFYQIER